MTQFWNNWGLRLLALALAVLAWSFLGVGQREQTNETTVEPFVTYRLPEDYMLLDSQDRVRVRLQGPASRIAGLNPFQVSVEVELRDRELGSHEIVLISDYVIAPAGLEVTSIEPNVLTVKLDREVSELRPIDVQLIGEPAAGAVAREPTVFPIQALITGPESRVSQLTALSTTPISLDGHALDFDTQARVISSDPLIRVIEPSMVNVNVRLDIPNAPLDPSGGNVGAR